MRRTLGPFRRVAAHCFARGVPPTTPIRRGRDGPKGPCMNMPLQSPESLTDDEVYAVTAYILSIDKIVPEDSTLDAKSLPQVKMPNRDGFVRWWPVPKR